MRRVVVVWPLGVPMQPFPSTVGCLLPAVLFIIAGAFGLLTFMARYRWNDRPKTQLFAAVAVMGTVGLIMWALIYL